eukprot:1156931-Pelagomonas_calceolata.AAC.9
MQTSALTNNMRADFERYDATRAEVMMDKHTNRPRGFGFVFFKDEGGLKDAIRDMHEKVSNKTGT